MNEKREELDQLLKGASGRPWRLASEGAGHQCCFSDQIEDTYGYPVGDFVDRRDSDLVIALVNRAPEILGALDAAAAQIIKQGAHNQELTGTLNQALGELTTVRKRADHLFRQSVNKSELAQQLQEENDRLRRMVEVHLRVKLKPGIPVHRCFITSDHAGHTWTADKTVRQCLGGPK